MSRLIDEAYVLRTQELGDADLIVTFLAREHGIVRGVARSARSSRRRFGGLLEPLTHVRAGWFEREGRELHRVESVEGVHSYAGMQSDPERQAACAVIAEICSNFAREGHADPDEFRLIGAVLRAMEGGGHARTLLRYFEYWTLKLHGLLPDLESCAACGASLSAAAAFRAGEGLLCRRCGASAGAHVLGGGDHALLRRIRSESPATLSASRVDGGTRGLEKLLRGTLEAYAERGFRTYRHFTALESFGAAEGKP